MINPYVRLGVHAISTIGVSKVINDIITNNTTVITAWDSFRVATGSFVIGSVIAEHTAIHVEQKLNAAHAWYVKHKTV